MTLKKVLLILFATFLVSIILFILWEKKWINKSSPSKILNVDALFSCFYVFLMVAIIVIFFLSLRDEDNPENLAHLAYTLLSSVSFGSISGLASDLYRESRHLRGLKTPDPTKLKFLRGPLFSYNAIASYGAIDLHFFLYYILGFVFDVPTYMTIESLPVDVFLFFLFSITVIVIGYLTKLNHDTYRYFSNLNPILIFCSFWYFGKNFNNLIKLNRAAFFPFLIIMFALTGVYNVFQSLYFRDNPYLYKKEKGPISKIILTINASIIGIEVFIIAVYVIILILTLASGVLYN